MKLGLLDKWNELQAYISANTPRNTRPRVSPAKVLDEGLLNPNEYNAPAANRFKDSMFGLLGVVPGVGDAASAAESADLFNRGDKFGGSLAALGALPMVPALGGIISPNTAKELNTVLRMPEDDIFKAAVANTPGASVDDSGLLMRVQRNQVPEQASQPSVRGGVFYLPEGAAQAKHYSTGKNGYGGSERIAGETLITNPLFTKGATGGKAPETAFDQLAGKGAYQAMRIDAIKSYGGYGASHSAKVQKVQEFLSKYAPEMVDHADYIVDNSKQGNQLAYALQEAAVGSAVRNAGHDAVLGYSKGKVGPFISEVFDVRESAYPDKFGGYEVWDKFTEPTGLLSWADEAKKAKK